MLTLYDERKAYVSNPDSEGGRKCGFGEGQKGKIIGTGTIDFRVYEEHLMVGPLEVIISKVRGSEAVEPEFNHMSKALPEVEDS